MRRPLRLPRHSRKTMRDNERRVGQGVARRAVGTPRSQRATRDGAARRLRRGSGRLGEMAHRARHLVEGEGLAAGAAALADALAGWAEISPPRLRPALT